MLNSTNVGIFNKQEAGVQAWGRLTLLRIDLRNALRDLCMRKKLYKKDAGDIALTDLAQTARDHNLIDPCRFNALKSIAEDTHFLEWSNKPIPGASRLKEIEQEIPRQIEYLKSL